VSNDNITQLNSFRSKKRNRERLEDNQAFNQRLVDDVAALNRILNPQRLALDGFVEAIRGYMRLSARTLAEDPHNPIAGQFIGGVEQGGDDPNSVVLVFYNGFVVDGAVTVEDLPNYQINRLACTVLDTPQWFPTVLDDDAVFAAMENDIETFHEGRPILQEFAHLYLLSITALQRLEFKMTHYVFHDGVMELTLVNRAEQVAISLDVKQLILSAEKVARKYREGLHHITQEEARDLGVEVEKDWLEENPK